MIRNTKIMKSAIFTAMTLFLISLGIGLFYVYSADYFFASIAFLVGGFVGLALLFAACYRLDTREDEDAQNEDYEYYKTLVPLANQDPKAFGVALGKLTGQSTQYIGLLIVLSLEAALGVVVISFFASIPSRVTLYLAVGLLTVVVLLVRSLFVKIEDDQYPAEMIATSQNWPSLLTIVSDVQKAMDARPIHRVAVVPGVDCSVSSRSNRFGFNVKNTLQIGHYLLGFCDEAEMKALLGHEFSHISNKDTLVGFKYYANRIRWEQLKQRAAKQNFLIRILFGEFALYYSKNLSIYHAAMGKALEYHADRRSVQLTSPSAFAKMLYKVYYLSNFRGNIAMSEIPEIDQVPKSFYTDDFGRLRNGLDEGKAVFDKSLAASRSEEFDSHPSFSERLSKAGIPDFPFSIDLKPSGAVQQECDRLLPYYDALWHQSISEEWEAYREEQTEAQNIVDGYSRNFKDEDACWQYGMSLERLERYDDAISFYDEMKLHYPQLPAIDFRKGLCMLWMENESGLALLQESANQDPYLIEGSLEAIYQYLMIHERHDEFEALKPWFEERDKVLKKLHQEGRGIESGDVLMPVVLAPEVQNVVVQKFSDLKRVSVVYFLQKEVNVAGSSPLLVGFETGIYDANKKDTDAVSKLVEDLCPLLGFDSYVVYPYEGNVMLFLKTFLDIDGAKIYTKKMAKESKRPIGAGDNEEI